MGRGGFESPGRCVASASLWISALAPGALLGLVLLLGALTASAQIQVSGSGASRAGAQPQLAGPGSWSLEMERQSIGEDAGLGLGSGSRVSLDVRGMGRMSRLACMLCVGVFLGVAGTSIAGIVAAAVAFPEFAAACGVVCGIGYS
jgi:hypothetical protein